MHRNLIGQKFGKLEVLAQLDNKRIAGKSRTAWRCKCDCGQEIDIIGAYLLKKNARKSCGCDRKKRYNFKNLVNQKFGDLLVKELLEEKTKTRGSLWLCKCSCGQEVRLPTNCLTSGNNKTCGDKIKHPRESQYCGELPIPHVTNTKQNAIKRNLEFSVSPEFLWNLFLKQDRKCALSGVDLYFTKAKNACRGRIKETNASIDRIDSSKGYTEDNVQWVHKNINRMKWCNSDIEFIEWCKKVVDWKTNGKTYLG